MVAVATRRGEWGRGYAGTRLGGGSCEFEGGALGGCLGSGGWIFGGFGGSGLMMGLDGGEKRVKGSYLSVVNLPSLYAAMKADERRKARRLRLP